MAQLQADRKTISLAILVALSVLLIALFLVWPLTAQGQLNSKISRLEHTLSTQMRIIASKVQFEQQYAALNRRSSTQGRLLKGSSQQRAEIDAQSRIKTILERHNVKLLQTQSKSTRSEDRFVEIITSVQLECKHAQLNDIIYDIEFGATQFAISRMDIRKQRVRSTSAMRDRSQSAPATQLRVSLDIKGFWRADAAGQ